MGSLSNSCLKLSILLTGLIGFNHIEAQVPIPLDPESVAQAPQGDTSQDPSPTPTFPFPTPTPFPNQCPFDSWKFIVQVIARHGNYDRFIPPNSPQTTLDCLAKEVEKARALCSQSWDSRIHHDVGRSDISTQSALFRKVWGFDNCVANYFGAGQPVKGGQRKYELNTVSGKCFSNGNCKSGILYLDSACAKVNTPVDITKVCDSGSYHYAISPISLIMDDNVVVGNRDLRITNFPINPHLKGQFFLWEASSTRPLLVWDPLHQGKITSGEQLFGNWTFGGKSYSSLNQTWAIKSEWKNGYEALGSLDQNGDNKISGQELSNLGLWFDHNQDGISQDGEVKNLEEVEITELYYQPDYTDPLTKSIIANKGYSRLVNGRLETGRSVDWYSDHASSQAELISKQVVGAIVCR